MSNKNEKLSAMLTLCIRLKKKVGHNRRKLKANALSEIESILNEIKDSSKELDAIGPKLQNQVDVSIEKIRNANPNDKSELKELKSFLINLIQLVEKKLEEIDRMFERMEEARSRVEEKRSSSLSKHIAKRERETLSNPKDRIRRKL